MEYMISAAIILLVCLIVLGLYVLIQRNYSNQQRILQNLENKIEVRLQGLNVQQQSQERDTQLQMVQFFDQLSSSVHRDLTNYEQTLQGKFDAFDKKVSTNLTQTMQQSQGTITNVVERLGMIDAAQKKLDVLSTDIVSLQNILTDKKARGTYGEIQLNQLLEAVFGARNPRLFETQKTLSTRVRVDAVVYAPEPLGMICIDAKFPLESYQKLMDVTPSSVEYELHRKSFLTDCKKHVDAIASKYIIPNETADHAFMFIPAEAVYSTIHTEIPALIEYAHKKKVWLSAPTTLMSTLTLLQTMVLNIDRDKNTAQIQQELRVLMQEFARYQERWENLSNHMNQVARDVREIHITSEKIANRFDRIVDIGENEFDGQNN